MSALRSTGSTSIVGLVAVSFESWPVATQKWTHSTGSDCIQPRRIATAIESVLISGVMTK